VDIDHILDLDLSYEGEIKNICNFLQTLIVQKLWGF